MLCSRKSSRTHSRTTCVGDEAGAEAEQDLLNLLEEVFQHGFRVAAHASYVDLVTDWGAFLHPPCPPPEPGWASGRQWLAAALREHQLPRCLGIITTANATRLASYYHCASRGRRAALSASFVSFQGSLHLSFFSICVLP